MSWYAYCIAERQSFPELARHRRPMPLSGVSGLFGNQTFLFPAGDLAVIVSEHAPEDTARMAADAQHAARDHARVIADCFKLSTVLPFRFATTFADDDGLRRSVRSNQRHFLANVERLRGKAEMHLKVLVDDTCPGDFNRIRPPAKPPSGSNISPACATAPAGSASASPKPAPFPSRCIACSCPSPKRSPASAWTPANSSSTSLT